MIERFQGAEGGRRLGEALRLQEAIAGDVALAAAITPHAVVEQYSTGQSIILQNGTDNDLFFVLCGSVSIRVNGREVARRHARQHVGEMAVIDPAARRSASVVALDEVTVARLTEPNVVRAAQSEPTLWRNLARLLCTRLRERNAFVRARNDIPVVFIGCSCEGLKVAQQIQLNLKHDAIRIQLWTDGVFGASRFPVEDLEAQLESSDFALMVLGPDDKVTSRGVTTDAPRDNVVFELGLFVGALGHRRTLLLKPAGADLKIPSDLLGLTPLHYMSTQPLNTALGAPSTEIREIVSREGPR